MAVRIPKPRPDLDEHMKTKMLSVLARKEEALTARQMAQYVSGLSKTDAEKYFDQLVISGAVLVEVGGRVNRYRTPKDASQLTVRNDGVVGLINAVLDEREKREPAFMVQRSAISAWLDALIAARDGGNLEATVDRVIEEMQELIF